MKAEDLISYIEEIADPRFSADWDSSGLHILGDRREIKRLAIALDPIENTIKDALLWGADFILTHHPTTLSPRLPNKDNSFTRVIKMVIRKDAWLYCAHTSLDVNLDGPVSWLAKDLGLRNLTPIEPILDDGNLLLGYGIVGDISDKMEISSFLHRLASILGRSQFVTVGKEPLTIKKIAYCPGSGMSLTKRAFELGSDIFISGDLKYHVAQSIEELGFTIDVGHFILEEIMMQRFAETLKREFKEKNINIEIKFFKGLDPISIKEVLI